MFSHINLTKKEQFFLKYVVIPEPGRVEIREAEKPVLTKGHAIIKLLYGGICGSDLGSYNGTFLYANYPLIPGHEFSGEIVEIGENDLGLKPGMIVTANPYYNCGECYSCKRGLVNCCTDNKTLGCQHDGAFREYFSVPIERIYDGKGVSAKELALVEPFCISYHSLRRTGVKAGDRVLVVGAGTIGYMAAKGAKMMGAEVYVSDIAENKLKKAEELGIDGTILNSSPEDFGTAVEKITNGSGFDVCIEAVGLPSTFMNCIDAAAFRGRVAVVGVGKQSLDFFYTVIQKKELDIFGSRNAMKEDFLGAIDNINSGNLSLLDAVSAQYNYKDALSAFDNMSKNSGNLLKLMLKFE